MSDIDIQIACQASNLPGEKSLLNWCLHTLNTVQRSGDLALRISDEAEIHELNLRYRGKDKSTNVLSFPSDLAAELAAELMQLGDIVICPDVVEQEAREQGKEITAHWAHMVVHGTLHLCGYDHIDDDDAEQMEALEIQILEELGFADPYHSNNHD